MSTPKANRDEAFYRDAFTSITNWGPGIFEAACEEHGISYDPDKDFLGQTALKLWEAYSEKEKDMFRAVYDDWLLVNFG